MIYMGMDFPSKADNLEIRRLTSINLIQGSAYDQQLYQQHLQLLFFFHSQPMLVGSLCLRLCLCLCLSFYLSLCFALLFMLVFCCGPLKTVKEERKQNKNKKERWAQTKLSRESNCVINAFSLIGVIISLILVLLIISLFLKLKTVDYIITRISKMFYLVFLDV